MQSRASATWEGDLFGGKGTATAGSGVFTDAKLSWKARAETGAGGGATTPEELLAAAHASCFCMALSNGLAQAGKPPARLEATCVVTFGPKSGGGFEVKSSALEVKGRVPGMDEAAFKKAAEDAKAGCPISAALKNNIQLSVQARLEP
ncbi:MAG: OsmC family peroxiredoxin [Myxococcaceae bacterium]